MRQMCPQCKKKEAKKSLAYPDILVCYCGGDVLREVQESPEPVTLKDKFVYHVAHPTIKGEIVHNLPKGLCKVSFQEEVLFSGNPSAGPSKNWVCQKKFLFESEDEARKNHNPNLA